MKRISWHISSNEIENAKDHLIQFSNRYTTMQAKKKRHTTQAANSKKGLTYWCNIMITLHNYYWLFSPLFLKIQTYQFAAKLIEFKEVFYFHLNIEITSILIVPLSKLHAPILGPHTKTELSHLVTLPSFFFFWL